MTSPIGSTLIKKQWIDVIHKQCGGVVVQVDYRPKVGEIVSVDHLRLPDGSKPKRGDAPYCPTCKCNIFMWALRVVGGYS